ncbi:MAG: ABC transporter substrate-binding protein [Lautropia sp.]
MTRFDRVAVRLAVAAASMLAMNWAASQSTVKIAVIAPVSGAFSVSGQDMVNGARLAADQINAAGGIKSLGGAKIEIIVGDAGDTPDKTTAIARQILARRPAGAIGSWYSSLSLAGSQIAEQQKVPWISGSYTDALVERGFRYTYQTVAGVRAGNTALELIFERFFSQPGKKTRVAVVKDTNVASNELYKGVQSLAQRGMIELAVTETWTPPLSDATPIATTVMGAKVEVVVISGTSTTDSALLQRQLNAMGSKAVVIGLAASQGNPTYLSSLGQQALQGMMVPIQGFPGKGSEAVNDAYVKLTKQPFMDAEALTGYTDLWVLAKAVEAAKSDKPEDVQVALRKLHLVDDPVLSLLPGGNDFRFGENGRRVGAQVMIIQWQNGVPKVIFPDALANAKPL